MKGVRSGNAADEGAERGGWFVGAFMPEGDVRRTGDVEIKFARHAAGEERADWAGPARTHTLSILIAGRFRLRFADGDVVLAREGDYCLWMPGTDHTWACEEDCTIVTVRWPSQAG